MLDVKPLIGYSWRIIAKHLVDGNISRHFIYQSGVYADYVLKFQKEALHLEQRAAFVPEKDPCQDSNGLN